MFFVLEWPDGADPRCWFAYDPFDLLAKVADDDPLRADAIWDCATPRELLEQLDAAPDTPGVEQRWPGICSLGREYGWDTPLYRADHRGEPGHYGPAEITVVQACDAALKARGRARLYADEATAVLAFENDAEPLWAGDGWKARWALREQLVATEVLADS